VRLTDALRQYAPAGITVPRFGDRAITLLDLATHSVGLPREIGDVPPNTIPFTWPTKQERWSFLAGYTLPWAPGTVAAYSNVSFDLLADALAAASGKDYPTLLDNQSARHGRYRRRTHPETVQSSNDGHLPRRGRGLASGAASRAAIDRHQCRRRQWRSLFDRQ